MCPPSPPVALRRRCRKPLAWLLPMLLALAGCAAVTPAVDHSPPAGAAGDRPGRQAAQDRAALVGSGRLYEDPPLATYVNQVAERLIPPGTPASPVLRVQLLSDPHPNAFALPDGALFITTGLLARLDNEAQLAALLGHEMAHVLARHALRLQAACGGPGEVSGGRGAGGTPAAGCGAAARRSLEREADLRSLDMVLAAHYDPQEALAVFRHQAQVIELEGEDAAAARSAHPRFDERRRLLAERLQALGRTPGSGRRGEEDYARRIEALLIHDARLNLRLGRYRWAQMDLERLLSRSPRHAAAHYWLGETHRRRGGADGLAAAAACYRRAMQLAPGWAAPRAALGVLHFKQGRRQEAGRLFRAALALAPEDGQNAYIAQYLAQCQGEETP